MGADEGPPSTSGVPSGVGDNGPDAVDPGRRKFLIATIGAVGGTITAAVGVPAIAFVTGSARTATGEEGWIRLGSVGSIEPGAAPTLVKATIERRTGYLVEEQEVSIFVTTENGQDFVLLSNVCTHLGCRVRWVEAEAGFHCPCHNATFGRNGEVLAGPPPRPRDRYDYKVEDAQLFFKEV
jgi:Rieske Fe-S protein